jgi:hypothetical protein
MSKVVLATLFAATGNADALDDLAHEVAGTSPPPANTGTIVTDIDYSSNEREPVENEQNADFALRLPAAFQGEPRETLISRGEAKGAAETEQLWTTLRIVWTARTTLGLGSK